MIMSRIFSSAEPDPQLTWTAMLLGTYHVEHLSVQFDRAINNLDLTRRFQIHGIWIA
jgi:hypothetical protein